jgi:hypothetical protein
MSHTPYTIPAETIVDRLEQIRDHFDACIAAHEKNLPTSATTEEILATRKLNNLILDLTPIKTKPRRP